MAQARLRKLRPILTQITAGHGGAKLIDALREPGYTHFSNGKTCTTQRFGNQSFTTSRDQRMAAGCILNTTRESKSTMEILDGPRQYKSHQRRFPQYDPI
jgi:hypothetical protein